MKPMYLGWVALALAIATGPAQAGPPNIVSHQGVLTLADGTVVQDGSYTLTFQVCDAAHSGTCPAGQQLPVQVTDGLYNVLLSDTALLDNMKSGSFPYLNVRIESGTDPGITAPIDLAPRQQLASVPFALVSGDDGGDVTVSTTPACPGSPAGTLRYGTSPPGLEVCNGAQWVAIGFRHLDVLIYDQASPSTYQTLSLGQYTGPGPAIVFLAVNQSDDQWIALRPKGDTNPWYPNSTWSAGAAFTNGGNNNTTMISMVTDANGDLEWRSGGAVTQIRLLGFVR